jgi:hypothetical protein
VSGASHLLKPPSVIAGLGSMAETEKKSTSQPDSNLAAEEHPRPSQAEGDLKTVEADLKAKEQQGGAGQTSGEK